MTQTTGPDCVILWEARQPECTRVGDSDGPAAVNSAELEESFGCARRCSKTNKALDAASRPVEHGARRVKVVLVR